ncbi:MAG: Ger(x)C family spore germination protein [Bacilli bacterium]
MKIKLAIILVLLLFTTGCWNYNELDDFAIVTGMGVDKDKDGIILSVLIANGESMGASNKEGNSESTIITGKGKTISEAIINIETKSAKDLYMGHLNEIVIEDDLAFDSIYDIMDYLIRNPEVVKKYYVLIAKDNKSREILQVLSPLENFPSQNIALMVENSNKRIGYVPNVTLFNFAFSAVNKGLDGYFPSISIEGKLADADDSKDFSKSKVRTSLKLGPLALFKGFKLDSYANIKESKGLNIINNKINELIIDLPCYKDKNKYVITKLDDIKAHMSVKIKDKVYVKIDVSSKGSINETNCKLNLTDNKVIERINEDANKEIKKIITKAIKKVIYTKSDAIGIEYLADKVKNGYNVDYDKVQYSIKTRINLKTKGSLENTLKEVQDEDR